jgi:hypothetical protein
MSRHLVSEAQWQRVVCDALSLHGWSWLHVHPLMTRDGEYRTPTSGTLARGWPDLLAVHPTRQRTLLIECKGPRTAISPAQREVHDILRQAGHEVLVLRPRDLPLLLETLRASTRKPETAA